jgi:hypothetical protein
MVLKDQRLRLAQNTKVKIQTILDVEFVDCVGSHEFDVKLISIVVIEAFFDLYFRGTKLSDLFFRYTDQRHIL